MNSMSKNITSSAVAITCLLIVVAQPAVAADLFASAKSAIKDTAGTGSGVETAILAAGALGGAITGFMTKNWVGALGGFATGMIFWNVAAPLVGL